MIVIIIIIIITIIIAIISIALAVTIAITTTTTTTSTTTSTTTITIVVLGIIVIVIIAIKPTHERWIGIAHMRNTYVARILESSGAMVTRTSKSHLGNDFTPFTTMLIIIYNWYIFSGLNCMFYPWQTGHFDKQHIWPPKISDRTHFATRLDRCLLPPTAP